MTAYSWSCSGNTGAYCRARANLSESVIRRLTIEVADNCERQVAPQWLWHGRHVRLADGTTISMPDTPANQEAYPQPPGQEPGLGFPISLWHRHLACDSHRRDADAPLTHRRDAGATKSSAW